MTEEDFEREFKITIQLKMLFYKRLTIGLFVFHKRFNIFGCDRLTVVTIVI